MRQDEPQTEIVAQTGGDRNGLRGTEDSSTAHKMVLITGSFRRLSDLSIRRAAPHRNRW